jgi:hypothetical protein
MCVYQQYHQHATALEIPLPDVSHPDLISLLTAFSLPRPLPPLYLIAPSQCASPGIQILMSSDLLQTGRTLSPPLLIPALHSLSLFCPLPPSLPSIFSNPSIQLIPPHTAVSIAHQYRGVICSMHPLDHYLRFISFSSILHVLLSIIHSTPLSVVLQGNELPPFTLSLFTNLKSPYLTPPHSPLLRPPPLSSILLSPAH